MCTSCRRSRSCTTGASIAVQLPPIPRGSATSGEDHLVPDRAAAAGLSMGDYLDSLVRQDDLRARLQADADTMATAGLGSPERAGRSAAVIAALPAAR